MKKHTPEPWIVVPFLTPHEDDDPMQVYKLETGDLQKRFDECEALTEEDEKELDAIHEENEANAERMGACVSGCKGIEDPENTVPALVNAFKTVMDALNSPDGILNVIDETALRAVLAKVKGAV